MKREGAILAAGLFAAIASSAGAAAETIRIGHISNFSGPFAVWGQQFKRSIEAYQKVHGDTVNGNKVEVLYRDVGAVNPARARQLAEELILRDKIKVLTGFSLTPNAMAVAEVLTESKTPLVIFNAATSVIPRMSPYYVRVSTTVQQYVRPLGLWAGRTGKKKTAYTMVSDYAPGHDAEEAFIDGFTKAGGKVLGKDRIPLATTDYAPYMERAANSGAEDVYIFMPAGTPSIAIIREFAKRGLKAKGMRLLTGGEVQEIYLPAIGDDVVGTISALHYTETNTTAENAKLKQTFKDMFGKDAIPDMGAVAAWDGMHLIYEAIRALGPKFTGDQFIAFARGKTFNSPRGPIMIDPVERDIVQNVYIRKVEKRGGKLVNVDFYTEKMVKDPWKEARPPKK
ncbi:MAG: ABC transporter substrate-binding protein [Beijerinckiaceae bacterium]